VGAGPAAGAVQEKTIELGFGLHNSVGVVPFAGLRLVAQFGGAGPSCTHMVYVPALLDPPVQVLIKYVVFGESPVTDV
jgi:hypothetical protein